MWSALDSSSWFRGLLSLTYLLSRQSMLITLWENIVMIRLTIANEEFEFKELSVLCLKTFFSLNLNCYLYWFISHSFEWILRNSTFDFIVSLYGVVIKKNQKYQTSFTRILYSQHKLPISILKLLSVICLFS